MPREPTTIKAIDQPFIAFQLELSKVQNVASWRGNGRN